MAHVREEVAFCLGGVLGDFLGPGELGRSLLDALLEILVELEDFQLGELSVGDIDVHARHSHRFTRGVAKEPAFRGDPVD